MKYRFNLKNTAVTLIAVFTIFFLAEYIFRRDYNILFFAVCFFSCLVLICLFIYLLLLFDNRYRLTYANADELSDETKEKIIKENIKETKETSRPRSWNSLTGISNATLLRSTTASIPMPSRKI